MKTTSTIIITPTNLCSENFTDFNDEMLFHQFIDNITSLIDSLPQEFLQNIKRAQIKKTQQIKYVEQQNINNVSTIQTHINTNINSNISSINSNIFSNITLNISEPIINQYHIGLAVSGGADSLCMTALMQRFCQYITSHFIDQNIKVHFSCLIVNHKLRQESTSEALHVQELLKSKNIISHILTISKDINQKIKSKSNIQSNARKARYSLLIDFCLQNNINYLCTAHTMNDQAETVLMRIMRGSGVDGLVGIPKKQILSSINIIRPMLNIKKVEIEKYLRKIGWQWIEDPSNQNIKYERVKIRKLIQSLSNQTHIINDSDTLSDDKKSHFNTSQNNLLLHNSNMVTEKFCLLADNMARTKQFLNKITNQTIEEICTDQLSCKLHIDKTYISNQQFLWKNEDYISIDATKFLQLYEEIKFRVFRIVLQIVGQSEYVMRLHNLKLAINRIDDFYHNDNIAHYDTEHLKKKMKFTLSGCVILLRIIPSKCIILQKEKMNIK